MSAKAVEAWAGPPMKPALLLCLVLLTLSGCSAPAATVSMIRIDSAGHAPAIDGNLPLDPASHPASRYYAQFSVAVPDHYTAFDQLVQWADTYSVPLNVSHASFGFFLAQIDHWPVPGAHSYWALSVNGTMSDVGMAQVKVVDGSRIAWTLTSY
jgi:Domain of unknown function (DUF4430)